MAYKNIITNSKNTEFPIAGEKTAKLKHQL
jgi:hypothetical protein